MPTYYGFGIENTADRRIKMDNTDDLELIDSSIRQILETEKGERVMLPEFGSRLRRLVFEPLDEILENQIRREVAEAIARWEDRIWLEDVRVEPDTLVEHGVIIILRYRLKDEIQDTKEYTLKFRGV